MKPSRVPRTLDGLVSAAQQDVPSDAALSRLADTAEAGPPSATRRVLSRLSTPRGLVVLAACVIFAGALATRSMTPFTAEATPAVAPMPMPSPRTDPTPGPEIGSREADRRSDEMPTVDVRSLPGSADPPARHKAPAAKAGDEELSESALLQLAHDAIPTNPRRALALTGEHARRFPTGVLAQEREVIAVEALVRIGRRDEARARAATFLATYPSSAYRSRASEAIDGPPGSLPSPAPPR